MKEPVLLARKPSSIRSGEMLLEEFMKPLGLLSPELARGIGLPPNRITHPIYGKRATAADAALRLARYLGWPAQIWLRIQADHGLEKSRRAVKHKQIAPRPQALAGQALARQARGA